MSLKDLFPGNDYTVDIPITAPATATGIDAPATGLTGLTAHLSATDRGATIHAALSESMAERSGTPGQYHATFEGSDTLTHLDNATYWNKDIYLVVQDTGQNILTSNKIRVRRYRRAGELGGVGP